jgi:hypothetical protein
MPDRTPPARASTQLPLPRRELRGVVERITYQNPETGYTVARLACCNERFRHRRRDRIG